MLLSGTAFAALPNGTFQRYAPNLTGDNKALTLVGAVERPVGPGPLGLIAMGIGALVGHGDSIASGTEIVNVR